MRFLSYRAGMAEDEPLGSPDLITLGRRIRHLRRAKGLTLEALGVLVGRSASQLSLLENGRREPRLSVLQSLAAALGVSTTDLLGPEPPSRRAGLEIALERAQRRESYAGLGLPIVRPGARLSTEVLESLVGLHAELARQAEERAATPEEARRANAELRREMRERDNYFEEIELRPRPSCTPSSPVRARCPSGRSTTLPRISASSCCGSTTCRSPPGP